MINTVVIVEIIEGKATAVNDGRVEDRNIEVLRRDDLWEEGFVAPLFEQPNYALGFRGKDSTPFKNNPFLFRFLCDRSGTHDPLTTTKLGHITHIM